MGMVGSVGFCPDLPNEVVGWINRSCPDLPIFIFDSDLVHY